MRIHLDIQGGEAELALSPDNDIGLSVDSDFVGVPAIPYVGPYTVTPTSSPQLLETGGMLLERDIQIDAIPNNYGLITWNGSTLTVS